jgi:hypothetical protein
LALVQEDGTGKSNADSFALDVAEVTAYHEKFGNAGTGEGQWDSVTPLSDAVLEAKIRRGWQAFNSLYRFRLKGIKTSSTQNSILPRSGMTDEDDNGIDSDAIPEGLKNASFELARIVPDDQAIDESLWIRRVEAGEVSVLFQQPMHARSVLDHVEALVAPFMERRGGRG